jgi:hypothetical protein
MHNLGIENNDSSIDFTPHIPINQKPEWWSDDGYGWLQRIRNVNWCLNDLISETAQISVKSIQFFKQSI